MRFNWRVTSSLSPQIRGRLLGCAKVGEYSFGLLAVDDGGQGGRVGVADGLEGSEMLEQSSHRGFTDTGNFQEFARTVTHFAALPVERDREAVSFVANELYKVEYGVVVVEDYGIVFLAEDVDDFLAFRNGGEGLVGDAEGFEGLGGGV